MPEFPVVEPVHFCSWDVARTKIRGKKHRLGALRMNDDTADLLQMFQKLGTTDHDVLIKQMQTIIPGIDPGLASFFLEASNWTLQVVAITCRFSTHSSDCNSQLFRQHRWWARLNPTNCLSQ